MVDWDDIPVQIRFVLAALPIVFVWYIWLGPIVGQWLDTTPWIIPPIAYLVWHSLLFLGITIFLFLLMHALELKFDIAIDTTDELRYAVAGFSFYSFVDLLEPPFALNPDGVLDTSIFLWKSSVDTLWVWIMHAIDPTIAGRVLFNYAMLGSVAMYLTLLLVALGPELKHFLREILS